MDQHQGPLKDSPVGRPSWKGEKPLDFGAMLEYPFHQRKVINPFCKSVCSLELLGTKSSILGGLEYGYHDVKLGRLDKQHLNLMKFDVSNI